MASNDPTYTPLGTSCTPVVSEAAPMLQSFWPDVMNEIRSLRQNDFKAQELPLARIKKIMKLDEDVKMISAEAPVLFAKAAEIFISELSLRSWIHTEENKRRTLQKNDIAMAVTKYDQFDFLIDIVPRDEIKTAKRPDESAGRAAMMPDQVQYYFQLAQQHQAAMHAAGTTTTTSTPQQQQPAQQQIAQQASQQVIQQPVVQVAAPAANNTLSFTQVSADSSPTPVGAIHANQMQQQVTTQVYQQVTTPNGEVQTIPIQLTQSQLQAIAAQMQGKQPGQPIIIQTASNTAGQQAVVTESNNTSQFGAATQPLFQVPLLSGSQPMSLGSQQVYIQGTAPTNTDQVTHVLPTETHAS